MERPRTAGQEGAAPAEDGPCREQHAETPPTQERERVEGPDAHTLSEDAQTLSEDAQTLSEDARIDAVAKLVPELGHPHERTVTPLSGGITNRNYRVDSPRGSYVLRLGGSGTEVLGIDRAREHACSCAAESAGIGAEVIAFVPEHRALVTRFIEGRVLDEGAMRDPSVMRRAALALRCYHDGPPVPGRFSAFATVRDYMELARARGVAFPDTLPAALATLARVERALGSAPPAVPCHNDLLPANFIDDGARTRIIDWEYGAMGDRSFDLGNLAAGFQLGAADEEALLAIYFGEARQEDLRRLRLFRLASDMRECMWGFLQAGVSDLDFDFLAYGRTHLARFLASAEALPERLFHEPDPGV